uniref:H15 domain-containing protein n=1 Tax=Graphocephala atropunctata TaxID=36148 RepID=A0A1B6MTR7_9HEMI
MVVRKVTLAQAVCAVYSLSKPEGSSRAEIATFCRKRFGVACNSRVWERLLERAIDERLLIKFRRRYYLARSSCSILWAYRREKPHHRELEKGRKRKACRPLQKRRSPYTGLWCEKRHKKEKMRTKRHTSAHNCSVRTKITGKGQKNIRTKMIKCRKPNRSERGTKRTSRPNSHRSRSLKVSRYNLRPKHLNDRPKHSQLKQVHKNRRVQFKLKTNSTRCSKKMEVSKRQEFHKTVLRQVRDAVPHAKSWDRLNEYRQRNQKENQELVKDSRLVQKILMVPHAASWDDLNLKLRRIKDARNSQEVGAGAAPSRKVRRTYSKF